MGTVAGGGGGGKGLSRVCVPGSRLLKHRLTASSKGRMESWAENWGVHGVYMLGRAAEGVEDEEWRGARREKTSG